MRRVSTILATFSLAALLAGCPKPTYPECKNDGDCAGHAQVCLNGFCKQCREDAQCPAGQTCKDNGCVPKAECAEAKDCAAGQKCSAGKCVAECTPETAAQDCGEGRSCVAGRCAAEEPCNADADCSSGKACVQGRCRADASRTNANLNEKLACDAKPLLFDYDDASLSAQAREAADAAWQCLQRSSFKRLTIAGHTDERGTTEYNVALGNRRAEAVRRYLVGLGAESRKLRTVSYGKERPADPGHDEAAYAKNRRVELQVEQ